MSDEETLERLSICIQEFMEWLCEEDDVDAGFVVLFDSVRGRHLRYSQNISYGRSLEIVYQLLKDMGLDPEPYVVAAASELSIKSPAGALKAGGVGES